MVARNSYHLKELIWTESIFLDDISRCKKVTELVAEFTKKEVYYVQEPFYYAGTISAALIRR